MQEDAYHLTLSQFIDKHGFSQAEVWYTIHFGEDIEPDFEPEPLEMDDGS